MATVVLLPGMDGSGLLFEEFVAALPVGLNAVVVKYPPDRALDYRDLEAVARSALPTKHPFLLVGESFSGPIAISLAAAGPAGLRGVVLVCSFARSPVWAPRSLRPLISLLPVWLVPLRVAAAVLLGRSQSPTLRARLRSAIANVKPTVWRARLGAVLSTDVTALLSKVHVPLLYLRAAHDRVVPRSASELISQFFPKARVVELDCSHFLLQAKPAEAASQVQAFAREVGFAF